MVANVFKRSVVPLLLLMMVITINWTETRFRPTFSSSTCHTGRPDSGSLSSPTQQSREIMSRAFRLLPLTALVAASLPFALVGGVVAPSAVAGADDGLQQGDGGGDETAGEEEDGDGRDLEAVHAELTNEPTRDLR